MGNIKLLSLLVPAYKQEKTIVENIKKLDQVLATLPYKYEIIVIVDGFLDKTYEKTRKIRKRNIKIFGYKKKSR